MKLKNLLFATMVAFAFTACTKDGSIDDLIPPTQEAPEAVVDFAANTKSGLTKADGDVNANDDDKVYSLTAVIFNEDGTKIIGIKRVEGESYEPLEKLEVTGIKTKAVKIKALLLANVPMETISGCETLNDYLDAIQEYGTGVDFNASSPMIMSSGVMTSGSALAADGVNKLGYGSSAEGNVEITESEGVYNREGAVFLYRTVARVQLESVVSKGLDESIESISVTRVFMSNVMSDSKIAAASAKGEVYGTSTTLVRGNDDGAIGDLLVNEANRAKYNDGGYAKSLTVDFEGLSTSVEQEEEDWTSAEGRKPIFYVPSYEANFKNSKANAEDKAYTLLCVKAKVVYTLGLTVERYYTVKIGNENNEGDKIARNTVYKVSLTLKGNGSDNPYNPEAAASLDAKVVVAPWDVVTQAPEIE